MGGEHGLLNAALSTSLCCQPSVLFPRAHLSLEVAAIRCVCTAACGAAVSVPGGLLGGHGLTWLGGKQVYMWVWVIVVAMAQNLKLRKLTEKVTVPVLDAVFVILPAVTGHLQNLL